MSSAQRLMLVVGAVVIVVVGFIVLAPGSDNGGGSASTTPATSATTAGAATTTPAAPAAPAATTIVVKGGKPVGGIQTIKAKKGDRVVIDVSSPDTTSEVHFHGYDIKREMKAGGKVEFAFDANLEGIFEMELEDTSTQIAKIEISPS